MITQKSVQLVLDTARIEDVVGDYVNLNRRGVNLLGLCPFHDEKTPSFTVSPHKNIFKCFGCGRGGTPVNFIMEHEQISFPEAIRFLSQKYNIELEETGNMEEEKEQRLITDSLYIVNNFAKDYFVENLFKNEEGRTIGLSYFKERGLRINTLEKFQLGYATSERDGFTKIALSKKFNIDYLRKLGLTTQSDSDFFRSRVMFTIHNLSGKVVGFAGRILSSHVKTAKYINSPESEIYNKSELLYGLYFAKEAIRKKDECIIVEGYLDVISLHQSGIENVVATSGTSLTKKQIHLIKRFTQNIKILYDGDAAGIKAALRGLDMVLEADMNVKLVLLPDGHDPDSFLALKGSSDFTAYVNEHEEDFIFFKTRILLKETENDPIKKSIIIRDIVDSIAKIPDTFKRSLYTRQCSHMLDMDEQILISEINKSIKAAKKFKNAELKKEKGEPVVDEDEWLTVKPVKNADDTLITRNDAWIERAVCTNLINFGDKWFDEENKIRVADYIIADTSNLLEHFDIELYKQIIEITRDAIHQNIIPDAQWYLNYKDEKISAFAVNALSTPYVYASWEEHQIFLQTQKIPEENYVKDTQNVIYRLILKKSRKYIGQLEAYFSCATDEEMHSEDYAINIKVYQELIKQRNEVAKILGTVTLI